MIFCGFFWMLKRDGKTVVGYGAGQGQHASELLRDHPDLLAWTDRTYKHGRYVPGVHIPIHEPDRIHEAKPDYVLILPWNLRTEIVEQLSYIREWGGRCVVPIPALEVID